MIIFPNRRAVRNYLSSFKSDGELPQTLSIGEFLERATYIDGFKKIDKFSRVIIFNRVVKQVEEFSNLKIDSSLLSFLRYSDYFFSLYSELTKGGVSIEMLREGDYYEDYKKHIDILHRLYTLYQNELKREQLIDPLFIVEDYILNRVYIDSLDNIEIHLEGYLSHFDKKLFDEISEITPLQIVIYGNRFNYKFRKDPIFKSMDLKGGFKHKIDWKRKELIESEKSPFKTKVQIVKFQDRLTQVAFVKERIQHFVDIGLEPEDIGVILLDESFAPIMRKFDIENNLSFAMGLPFSDSRLYKFLNAVLLHFNDDKDSENLERLNRLIGNSSELQEIVDNLKPFWNRKSGDRLKITILTLLKIFKVDKKVIDLILKSLLLFETEMSRIQLKIAMKLFLDELREFTIDDISGGRVKVMGLLEARGSSHKAVIIIDFSDDTFPKRVNKDLFINSDIRRDLQLPLLEDRESLQKYHLYRVLQKADFGSISFAEGGERRVSHFIYDFNYKIESSSEYENFLKGLLFKEESSDDISHWIERVDEVESQYNFLSEPLSNSKIESFNSCHLKYHFQYVKKIKPPREEFSQSIDTKVGNLLHKALEHTYRNQDSYSNKWELRKKIDEYLEKEGFFGDGVVREMWLQRLNNFIDSEIDKFNQGVKVIDVEKHLNAKYNEFELKGIADRVELLPNGKISIVDYKKSISSSSRKSYENSLQLVLYYIILKELGVDVDINSFYYNSLQSGERVYPVKRESEVKELLDELKKKEGELLKINLNEIGSSSSCYFCDYTALCNID